MAKTGVGKAGGGLASLGRTLGSLALRFAPLALGALKAVGAAVAGLSLPVTATVAAIAGAAYLIWKHWEPIKEFFAKLWEGVKAAVSSAWERLKSIDWSGIGLRLLSTLAEGLRSAGSLVWDALKATLGKVADLLPGSDARTGPLSGLTASGSAIMATLGEGVRRSGASSLQRPLSKALARPSAGLALSLPAVSGLQPPGLRDPAPPAIRPPVAGPADRALPRLEGVGRRLPERRIRALAIPPASRSGPCRTCRRWRARQPPPCTGWTLPAVARSRRGCEPRPGRRRLRFRPRPRPRRPACRRPGSCITITGSRSISCRERIRELWRIA